MNLATPPTQPILIVGELIGPNEWRGIPDLVQLIPSGGRPGVEYCLVPSSLLGTWQRDGWWIVPRVDSLIIHGPAGSADGVLLLGYGEPIIGASPTNGRRRYCAHEQLLIDLGYLTAPARPDIAALRAETDTHKANATGAAKRAVTGAGAGAPTTVAAAATGS